MSVKATHVGDDFLQAGHPALGLFDGAGREVQVLAPTLEDDGETALLQAGVSVLLKPLRLPAKTHRLNVINGDWRREEREREGEREGEK